MSFQAAPSTSAISPQVAAQQYNGAAQIVTPALPVPNVFQGAPKPTSLQTAPRTVGYPG